jgi:hypothetical protein
MSSGGNWPRPIEQESEEEKMQSTKITIYEKPT